MSSIDQSKPEVPEVSSWQLCYDMAYFVLPHYVFDDIAKLVDLCRNSPAAAGPFFYFMAAKMRNVDPSAENAKQFHTHYGQLAEGRDYFAFEFPVPPPFSMSHIDPKERGRTLAVLAPHFCTVIPGTESSKAEYFILGQAPTGGGTTLRCILQNESSNVNCNLGPGPVPVLSAFIECAEFTSEPQNVSVPRHVSLSFHRWTCPPLAARVC